MNEYHLRYMEEADLPKVLRWRNSKRVRHNMFHDHILSLEEHVNWFRQLDRKTANFFIFEYQQVPVGVVSFHKEKMQPPFDLKAKKNEDELWLWGFYLGEVNAPKGTATMMGAYGLEYAFTSLSIERVGGKVLGFNKRSQRFHDRLGFRLEGILYKEHLRNGQYEDVYGYGMVKEEWGRPFIT